MKKVMMIFGTRPEAIKMAPLVIELKKSSRLNCIVTVTAQHRQMLDQVLESFAIEPDYDLDIMQDGQSLEQILTRTLEGLGSVMRQVKPDMVLVHGDTATTMVGSLAAYYQQIPVGHVEAGLRTGNKYSPFPEEINRQITGVIADLHFSPTELARETLLKENKDPKSIYVTGNTVIDALKTTVKDDYNHQQLDWVAGSRLLLLTAHRRENFGEPMRAIFRAVRRICDEYPDVKVIYPVHLNPIVQQLARDELTDHDQIRLIEPLDVLDFHNFMAASFLILSDSGGIQEEAPSLGKPVLVLRDTTERPEGIKAGTLRLVGTDEEIIYTETKRLLTDDSLYKKMAQAPNPYGDGKASARIRQVIEDWFA